MPNTKYVFICSPYRDNPVTYTELTKEACREVTLNTSYIPLAPHLYFTSFLQDNDPVERNKGIKAGLEWLEQCSAVFVIKFNRKVSDGMLKEINYAKQLKKPIIMFESFKDFYLAVSNTTNISNLESLVDQITDNPCTGCSNNHPHLLVCNGLCQNREEQLLNIILNKGD
ncbi:MAG: hypothetical protein ACI4Q8_02645 [Ruminococcus sp.]